MKVLAANIGGVDVRVDEVIEYGVEAGDFMWYADVILEGGWTAIVPVSQLSIY